MYISKLHVCCHHSLLPIQAVGIHPDDLVSVLTFKDIVLQVEAYLTKSHSDIWDLDIVKWIQVSLEVIIVAADFQKAKDGDLDPLLKCAKALDQALNKMAEMEEGWSTQTLGEEDADALQLLINCSWSTKAKAMLQTSEFTDKLGIYTTSQTWTCADHAEYLSCHSAICGGRGVCFFRFQNCFEKSS